MYNVHFVLIYLFFFFALQENQLFAGCQKKKKKFIESWLSAPEYAGWISKATSDTVAKCRWCCKEFDTSNMGESAL